MIQYLGQNFKRERNLSLFFTSKDDIELYFDFYEI